ncbi:hypothetical protein QZH41_016837 [Actinostola sp. cb2023]|nr:hypothetical protein QZH41_016837 [Actinostola sp. cb2023]
MRFYGRCPLTGGACLREVSAYGRCPLTGCVRLREVPAYGRCPLTGGACLREVSAYGRCPLTGDVRLREVSAYGRCPLTGGACLREVSAYGRCLLTGGACLREVSAYGRCLLTGGVRLREVSAYGRCPLTGVENVACVVIHVIQELTADQEDVCRIKCYRGDSCMSYNYKTSTGRCEINDSDEHQHPLDLVPQDDNIYGGTQNDCEAKPCPNQSTCKANVRTPGFKCLCVCNQDMPCDRALGMEDGGITDAQVKASSYYTKTLAPWNARLHLQSVWWRRGGWAVRYLNLDQWLQVDLLAKAEVTGIATQGFYDLDQWVKTYSIQHSDEGRAFSDYNKGEVLTGNADRNTIVKHNLKQFSARFVRFLPKSWNWHIAMRLEWYGCNPGPF